MDKSKDNESRSELEELLENSDENIKELFSRLRSVFSRISKEEKEEIADYAIQACSYISESEDVFKSLGDHYLGLIAMLHFMGEPYSGLGESHMKMYRQIKNRHE